MDAEQQAAHNALVALKALNDFVAEEMTGSAEQEIAIRKSLQSIASHCEGHEHVQRLCRFVRDQAIAVMSQPEDMQRRVDFVGSVDMLAQELRILRGDARVRATRSE